MIPANHEIGCRFDSLRVGIKVASVQAGFVTRTDAIDANAQNREAVVAGGIGCYLPDRIPAVVVGLIEANLDAGKGFTGAIANGAANTARRIGVMHFGIDGWLTGKQVKTENHGYRKQNKKQKAAGTG